MLQLFVPLINLAVGDLHIILKDYICLSIGVIKKLQPASVRRAFFLIRTLASFFLLTLELLEYIAKANNTFLCDTFNYI